VATATALGVLRAWDRDRAAAYSSGDVAALRRLYVPGSEAGQRDVAILRSYAARGLVVRGLRMQRLRADVLDRRRDRLRLRVLERVAGGTVVSGTSRTALPTDRAGRRTVVLVRGAGGWRVASVL
jgi:hypothetical protein